MPQFTLENQNARLKGVNLRTEKHGDENSPACDIALEFDATNDMLIMFGPKLRDSLYYKANKSQGDIEGIEQTKPDLKNDCLEGPLKLKYEGVGYKFLARYGTTGDMDVHFEDVRVGKIKVLPRQGGSCTFTVRLQVQEPDELFIGRLGTLIGSELSVDLTPPTA